MIDGVYIALIEILFFIFISTGIKIVYKQFNDINIITYFWLMFTILTGIWESAFILNYNNSTELSKELILKNEHVWTNKYDLTYLNPYKFSIIFYSEYGSYADRDYMITSNDWSRVIESSHALLCGLFALFCIICKINSNNKNYLICLSVSMGSQLMNSVLYMINYFIQCNTYNNVNYNNNSFPTGKYLEKRPFMYINIFWTIMPLYIIMILLVNNKIIKIKNNNNTTIIKLNEINK